MLLKPNIKIMLGLYFEFLSGNSVTSLTRQKYVKTKMADINLPCLHKLRFHSRMLVWSKDLSAVECKNDAQIRQAYLILHASFVF